MKKILNKRDNSKYNNIINEYKNFLFEERGISSEVQDESKHLSNLICDVIETFDVKYDENGVSELTEEYDYNVFNNDIILNVKYIFFIDRDSYLKNYKFIDSKYGYYNNDNKLYITVIIINGFVVVNTLITKIAHELKHVYQYIKTKRNRLNKSIYYNIISNRFIDNIGNIKSINDVDGINIDLFNKIKNIVYLSSKYEHESYSSELYNELCILNPLHYYEVLDKTNSYKAYISFKNDLTNIQTCDKNEVVFILNLYNLNYESFIKKSINNLNNFKHKLFRAISLYIDTKNENSEI